jgi:hypothetical protein
MDITAFPQIQSDVWKQKITSAEKYRITLECYDLLKKEGYRPYDMGRMTVTMQPIPFKKLVIDHGGACSTKLTNGGRLSAVWWNQVEICCLESVSNEYQSWTIDEEWAPL